MHHVAKHFGEFATEPRLMLLVPSVIFVRCGEEGEEVKDLAQTVHCGPSCIKSVEKPDATTAPLAWVSSCASHRSDPHHRCCGVGYFTDTRDMVWLLLPGVRQSVFRADLLGGGMGFVGMQTAAGGQ
eukprot:3442183-Amphidinium_carterae.1